MSTNNSNDKDKDGDNNLPRRSQRQISQATAKLLQEKQKTADKKAPVFMLKPRNQYDRMMYEAFFGNDANNNSELLTSAKAFSTSSTLSTRDDSNNKTKRSKFPIMNPETLAKLKKQQQLLKEQELLKAAKAASTSTSKTPNKKKEAIIERNQATIPEMEQTLAADSSQQTTSSTSTTSTLSDKDNPRQVCGNNLVEAKNRFRNCLEKRAKELGLLKPPQPPPPQRMSTRSRGSKRKTSNKRNRPSSTENSEAVTITAKDINASSFSTSVSCPDSDMVVFSRKDPAVYVYERNVPKYVHKLQELTKIEEPKMPCSVTPYQIGRMWADEHFPRAFKQTLAVQPPPQSTNPNYYDPDGPYNHHFSEDEKLTARHGTAYLPRPLPAPVDPVTGAPLKLRIPEAVRNGTLVLKVDDNQDRLLKEINSLADRPITELFASNMRRWKAIRNKHLEAYRQNSARYSHSFAVLKQMYVERYELDGVAQRNLYRRPRHEYEVVKKPEQQEQQQTLVVVWEFTTTTTAEEVQEKVEDKEKENLEDKEVEVMITEEQEKPKEPKKLEEPERLENVQEQVAMEQNENLANDVFMGGLMSTNEESMGENRHHSGLMEFTLDGVSFLPELKDLPELLQLSIEGDEGNDVSNDIVGVELVDMIEDTGDF